MGKLTKSTQTSLSCEINFCFKMYSKGSTRSRQAVQELLTEHNKDLIKDFFMMTAVSARDFVIHTVR